MSCCLKLFRSRNSFDLPTLSNVQGIAIRKTYEDQQITISNNSNGNKVSDLSKILDVDESNKKTAAAAPTPPEIRPRKHAKKIAPSPKNKTNTQINNTTNNGAQHHTNNNTNNTSPTAKDTKSIKETLSDKVRRKKIKQCVKVDPENVQISTTVDLHHHNNLSSSPSSTVTPKFDKAIEAHNTKTIKNLHNNKPKSPYPHRKRTSTNYEEIESISESIENVNIKSSSPSVHKAGTSIIDVGSVAAAAAGVIDSKEISKKAHSENDIPGTSSEVREYQNNNNAADRNHSNGNNSSDTKTEKKQAKHDSGIVSDEIEEAKKANYEEQLNGNINEEIPITQFLNEAPEKREAQKQTENTTDQKIGRKEGVISDRIEQKNNKSFEIEFYEKDRESEELIKKAITANDFLNNLMDAERLNVVVKAMSLREFDANSTIIKEGDSGSHFYVSAEGEFEVVKGGEVKKKFGPGVVFGELGILYKAKRFASITVTSKAKVWALERKTFQKIVMNTVSQEREQNIKFLQSVSVLNGLAVEVLHKIADLLKREFYSTGTKIIHQGDPGDKFYIIRGGGVTVTKSNGAGESRIVGILKRGECFGEQALINQEKRLASVIANEPGTECLTLDRIAFNNYLGTIAELRKKPVDQIIEVEAPKTNVINPDYDHINLSDLQIIGTLGVGGFGRVELVQYQKKETFALKILKKYEVANQGQIEHAYSEKEIMAICDSSFIVKLYKTYRDKKFIYFLMEACLGGDVWTQLQKVRNFDDKTSKFVTGCVVEAFDYLHSRNIIYRDLKPENLMLDSDGYVKLVDFGFAKRINPNNKTWTFSGTPEYVAPEIILNKGHDRAVDYWALGVFIHELLIGKPPFRGKDHMKTYNLILRGIDVVQMPQKIPKQAQNLIKGLCRQTPTDRLGYQRKGVADIKRHSWFEGFDWDSLHNRTFPAPLKRPINSNVDLSNFEEYPLDRDDPPDETSGWDVHF